MNNYPTKFCVNCNSYDPRLQLCGNPNSIRHVDPVTGKTLYEQAVIMRSDSTMCSSDANWFTERVLELRPWYRKLV